MSYSYIVNVSMVKMESVSKNDDRNWSRKSYFEIPPYGICDFGQKSYRISSDRN